MGSRIITDRIDVDYQGPRSVEIHERLVHLAGHLIVMNWPEQERTGLTNLPAIASV